MLNKNHPIDFKYRIKFRGKTFSNLLIYSYFMLFPITQAWGSDDDWSTQITAGCKEDQQKHQNKN